MKAVRQLGFLKLNLRPDGTPEEDHRVLALFRNRAELKKAYGSLQEDSFRLKDLIKQQEAATQRVQEMLDALEGRLGAAETAYPTLVFYQLRRLWQSGRELVSQFVTDLARQQEENERRAHLAQHNRQQFARRQELEQQQRAAEDAHAQAAAQLATLETERSRLTRFWHYFQRRALERRRGPATAAVANAAQAVEQAQRDAADIERTPAPEFPGLSLTARRSINLAAIAYAEVLCLRLTELKTPLVALAHEATARRQTPDIYGSPRECVLLMGLITRAQRLIADRGGVAEQIRERTGQLQQAVRYRGAADTAPVADSLALSERDALAAPALGTDAAQVRNVLAEDTWDLFRILLR